MEQDFVKLQNNFLFLVSFWCTHEIPICIEDWVALLRPIFWCRFSPFLVYGFYTGFLPIVSKIIYLINKKKDSL